MYIRTQSVQYPARICNIDQKVVSQPVSVFRKLVSVKLPRTCTHSMCALPLSTMYVISRLSVLLSVAFEWVLVCIEAMLVITLWCRHYANGTSLCQASAYITLIEHQVSVCAETVKKPYVNAPGFMRHSATLVEDICDSKPIKSR